MAQIIDIYTDTSLKGVVSMVRACPGTYEKVAKVQVDYEDKDTLPDHAFAWPEKRAYPINGKDMAYLSANYRSYYPPESKGLNVPQHVDENLEKAAYLYDFEIPEKRMPVQQKVASLQADDYLIPSLKKFPVRTKEDAQIVQNILIKNAHIMGYDHLTEACQNLVTKLASYKVTPDEVHPTVYKYAGLTQSNKDVLEAAILRRTDFAASEHTEKYEKLAEVANDMDFNRNNLLKIAVALEALDKNADLRRLYDKHIMNPMDSVFNTNIPYEVRKTASETFTLGMASRVSPDQVKNILGSEVYDESLVDGKMDESNLVHVVNSLPRDMITDFVDRLGL